MKKIELQKIATDISRSIAKKNGFKERSDGKYSKPLGSISLIFWLDARVNMGVGELTLNVGVEIPALRQLIDRVPGREKDGSPCFGGPAFRFVDLSKERLHDYVTKVHDGESDEVAASQIGVIWDSIAIPFFSRMSVSAGWVQAVENFLRDNRLSHFFSPTEARICVALMHVKSGSVAAGKALDKIGPMDGKKPRAQDFDEACKLHEQLSEDPSLLENLRHAVNSANVSQT